MLKMRCLFLVFALLLFAQCHGAPYKHLAHTYAPTSNTLHFLNVSCPFALQRACDALVQCVAFTTDGTLLQALDENIVENNGIDLYVKGQTPTPANIWPSPSDAEWGTNVLSVAWPFTFTSASAPFSDLDAAFARFSALMFEHRPFNNTQPQVQLNTLIVNIENTSVPLELGVDESYQLIIPNDGSAATLTANTFWGCLHGLQSFSQLVVFDSSIHSYVIGNAPWNIRDAPRFKHRGLMIDTARHFEPVKTIKTVIDSITYAKLNVLHWHVVDSQSFPFESRTYPNLWSGSFSSFERYTQEDMSDVVEYARQRGVRVVVEFDIPGHAQSWCMGYPDICPSTSCTTPLDPSVEATFDLMTGLFSDATGGAPGQGIFPDQYIHLGGDEVDTTCWTSSPRISAWLAQQNMTADQAYMYMVERAHDIVTAQGRHPINWEEVFLHFGSKLDKRTIVHIWLNHATLAAVVAAGYQGILSNTDVWYLDHLFTTWQQFYLNEPYLNITDPHQQQLVLGGEVCMWGETVDSSDIFNTVWPRAAAAAERLWSPADVIDTDAALIRLERFRCLLNQRGIDAQPTNSISGRDAPVGPGGCYVQ